MTPLGIEFYQNETQAPQKIEEPGLNELQECFLVKKVGDKGEAKITLTHQQVGGKFTVQTRDDNESQWITTHYDQRLEILEEEELIGYGVVITSFAENPTIGEIIDADEYQLEPPTLL